MQSSYRRSSGWFDVTANEILLLFKNDKNPESLVRFILLLTGIILTPVTLAGALWGYVRAYRRFMKGRDMPPVLAPLLPVVRVAIILGAIVIWMILLGIVYLLFFLFNIVFTERFLSSPAPFILIATNFLLSLVTLVFFNAWRGRIRSDAVEGERFGTARFAKPEELEDLTNKKGLYIGGNIYTYHKQGHLLTVAGTRGGKGTNLIIPNLIGKGFYDGSWVVIDPKGENATITARYQRSTGRDVLILDPWSLETKSGEGSTYNPLDLITGQENKDYLVDDASIIAEMIVPISSTGEQFFNDRARSLIAGMVIHLVESKDDEELTLSKIWEWLRFKQDDWNNLLAEMSVSDNAIVQATANETLNLLQTSDRTFGSVMASAQQYTDFLKSPALQKSLVKSNFDVKNLSNGNTTLYVIIPADKLKTHYQWLRLVVTTALRSVIRNKNKRVTFMLDEFAALGYLPEIETALSTYAGYNVTIWAILQSLIQLKDKYGTNWESFLGNTAVRHFFSVGDNFTADYLSAALGQTTFMTYPKTGTGNPNSSSRPLVTPDEVKRGSANNIFTLIEQRPPVYFAKIPYFEMPDMRQRYDENPYF